MALLPFNAEALSAVSGRARSAISGFTTGQRVISVLALVGLIIGGVVFMNVESKPSFQPLFTNLQASDSGAVVTQLTTSQIPYQLTNGGSTILVPANEVDKERVALAEQGLPNSGTVGFSNLEKSGITTSEFVQQVEYQQALEGQLQQTIESIQGIQSAQVNLVVPTQSTFAIGNQPPTTASILVNLAPGVALSSGQVQAIVHLAASATPGLTTGNVTVVDNHGDVLSAPGQASGGTGNSDSQQTAAYDRQLSTSLETLLYRLVGVGNAQVQVHALLNFNQQSTTTKGIQVGSNGQPIIAPTGTSSTSSSYTGAGTPPSGVLGSSTPTTIAGTSGNYTSTSSQVTNAVGQVTETVSQAPGQVQTTSVAVLINSAAKPKVSVSKVKALVAAAAGLNTANGDQLVVTALRFATPAALPAVTGNSMQLYTRVGEGFLLVLFILALLFFALRAAKKTQYDEVQVADFSSPRSLEGSYANVELPPAPLSFATVAPDAVLSQVNSYIEQRPAEVARMLRVWADEKSKEAL
jgi:flagellar M-ring protein FliF